MKAKIILTAMAAILFAACNNKQNSLQFFIPGTYANSAQGEYAQARDTLVITPLSDNNYVITRKTTFRAMRNGKLLRKHHKAEKFNAIWDIGKQELDETITGRVFHFDPDKKQLQINQAVYQKIN